MASGIERVKLEHVRKIPIEIEKLGSERGTCLWKAELLNPIAQARTEEDVNNYRPLTIETILMCLYAKVWDKRLRLVVKFYPSQQAFIPVDGCYEKLEIVQHAIKAQKNKLTIMWTPELKKKIEKNDEKKNREAKKIRIIAAKTD